MKLVVSGGGTGGHIYPGLAVIEFLLDMLPRTRVLFIGTPGGLEADIVPREGIQFARVRSGGIRGKSLRKAISGAVQAGLGVADALRILRDFGPDVVLGTGGYVSGPVILASRLLGIPCAIQEQNSVPGRTNLILGRLVQRVFCGWETARGYFHPLSRVIVTGNPVRKRVLHARREDGCMRFGLDPGKTTVLVLGGSRGARALVDAGLKVAEKTQELGVQMLFVAGDRYFDTVVAALGLRPEEGMKNARNGNIIVQAYVYDMENALAAADLVVCRAGGMTLAEITARGVPAVVVPSPNVVGNHQEQNARALERLGGCRVVEESEGASTIARACLELLEDRGRMMEIALASKAAGRPDAGEIIAKELIRLARGKAAS